MICAVRWLLACLAACSMAVLATACLSRGPSAAPASMMRMDAAVAQRIGLRHPEPRLYTAGQPDAGDWEALAAAGIRTVVNLRPVVETRGRDLRQEVGRAGLRYVHLPVAGPDQLTAHRAEALLQVLASAKGPVLLHCASGNRAGGLLALARWLSGQQTAEQALEAGTRAGMTSTRTAVQRAMQGCPADDARKRASSATC